MPQDQGRKKAWNKLKLSKPYSQQKNSTYSSKPKRRPQEKTDIEEFDDGTRSFFDKITDRSIPTKSPKIDEIRIENIDEEIDFDPNKESDDDDNANLNDADKTVSPIHSHRSVQDLINSAKDSTMYKGKNIHSEDDKEIASNPSTDRTTNKNKQNFKNISRETATVKKNHRVLKAPGVSGRHASLMIVVLE